MSFGRAFASSGRIGNFVVKSIDQNALLNLERLFALRAAGLLDTGPELCFDQLTQMAVSLLQANTAYISLVDDHRALLKSSYNRDTGADIETSETPLSGSFCKFAVISKEPFLVPDAKIHPLVKDFEAVGRGVISYAGVPLITDDGHAIGVICATDDKPRNWSCEEIDSLEVLARFTMSIIGPRIKERTRLERAVSAWGALDSWTARLLELTELHLGAMDSYLNLMRFSDSIRKGDERNAHQMVEKSALELREHLEVDRPDLDVKSQRNFVQAVQDYVYAEKDRNSAMQSFISNGSGLDLVEIAAANLANTEDKLRIIIRQIGHSSAL